MTDTTIHVQCADEIALNIASILRTFPEGERPHLANEYWQETWTPGCGVCAWGYVMEKLIPESQLVTHAHGLGLYDETFAAYQEQHGIADERSFERVKWFVIGRNDTVEGGMPNTPTLSMNAIADQLEAFYANS